MFEEGIEEFWSWWRSEGRADLIDALGGADSDIAERVSQQVSILNPGFEWQLTPREDGRYIFAISSGGNPVGRVMAETAMRWAPVDDDTFDYAAARVAVALDPFEYGGVFVDPGAVVVAVEPDELYEQLDMEVWIPGAGDLGAEEQERLGMLLLDMALGEDDSERWVGIVDPADDPPAAGVSLIDIHGPIAQFATTVTGEGWKVYERPLGPSEPLLVSMNVAAKHIDHLLKQMHVEIRIKFTEVTAMQMPSDSEVARVADIEEELLTRLGSDMVFAATETGLGQRVLHLYGADPDHVEGILDAYADHATHDILYEVAVDPGWLMLDELV